MNRNLQGPQRPDARQAHQGDPIGLEMPLTPEEIANKRFHASFRGYSKWEVEQFLLDVAIDYRRAIGLAQWAMERQSPGVGTPPPPPPPSAPVARPPDAAAAPAPIPVPAPPVAAPPVPAPPAAAPASPQLAATMTMLSRAVSDLTAQLGTMQQRLAALERTARPLFGNPSIPSMYQPRQAEPSSPFAAPAASMNSWWPKESPIALVRRA